MRILIVEDDPHTATFIAKGLAEDGHTVDRADNGRDGLFLATTETYDAIILDRMLPVVDGLTVLRTLRGAGNSVPVLVLTALGDVDHRVEGLRAGADDYLVKPFALPELLARLRALLRRRGTPRDAVLEIADLRIDTRSHRVTRGGAELALTTKEYALLEYLAVNAGRVMTREEIAEHVWNEAFDPFSNLIEVYIGRLRRIVDRDRAPKLIHTLRGAGYIVEAR